MDRIKWVDNLKGFILLLVCIGHVHFGAGIFANISSLTEPFWMPGFFFLSGYLFSSEKYTTFNSCVLSKSRSLLLPYISLSLLFSILDIRLYDVTLIPYHQYTDYPILSYMGVPETIQNRLQYLYLEFVNIFIAGASTPITTPFWFVNVLFWSSLLFYLIIKLSKRIGNVFIVFMYGVIMLGIGWICNKNKLFFPLNIHVVCTASFFISLGFLAKDVINKRLVNFSPISLICIILCLSPLYLYGININGAYHLYTNALGGKLHGLLISSLSGITIVIILFLLLSRIPRTSIIGGVFRNLARNSLIFLAVHYWVINTGDIIFHEYNTKPLYKYAIFIAALLISFLSFPLFRNKLYKLLGKEKTSIKEALSIR